MCVTAISAFRYNRRRYQFVDPARSLRSSDEGAIGAGCQTYGLNPQASSCGRHHLAQLGICTTPRRLNRFLRHRRWSLGLLIRTFPPSLYPDQGIGLIRRVAPAVGTAFTSNGTCVLSGDGFSASPRSFAGRRLLAAIRALQQAQFHKAVLSGWSSVGVERAESPTRSVSR